MDRLLARLAGVETPALVLDARVMAANIARVAAMARAAGVGLRPHAKTHKSARIAQAQRAAGAVGICCAKLGEAEVLAAAGVGPLLLTAPVRDGAKIARLCALAARAPGLMAVVDAPGGAAALGAAAVAAETRIDVLVDLDVGLGRTGAVGVDGALAVARAVADTPGLRLCGVQGYEGSLQHIEDWVTREVACRAVSGRIAAVVAALHAAGLTVDVVTGGGTGSFPIDLGLGVFTDIQVGSYVFSDAEYDAVALSPDGPRPIGNALFVLTQVVSANHPGFATLDAGSKSFTLDGPMPRVVAGAPAGTAWAPFGDEFGRLVLTDAAATVPVGTRVLCVVPHCDPTVALHDRYVVVTDDGIETWPVDARGRSD